MPFHCGEGLAQHRVISYYSYTERSLFRASGCLSAPPDTRSGLDQPLLTLNALGWWLLVSCSPALPALLLFIPPVQEDKVQRRAAASEEPTSPSTKSLEPGCGRSRLGQDKAGRSGAKGRRKFSEVSPSKEGQCCDHSPNKWAAAFREALIPKYASTGGGGGGSSGSSARFCAQKLLFNSSSTARHHLWLPDSTQRSAGTTEFRIDSK